MITPDKKLSGAAAVSSSKHSHTDVSIDNIFQAGIINTCLQRQKKNTGLSVTHRESVAAGAEAASEPHLTTVAFCIKDILLVVTQGGQGMWHTVKNQCHGP